jgi:acyl-CoA thioesterase I
LRKDLDPKIAAMRSLAAEFKTLLVPLDGIFTDDAKKATPSYWTADGVHPTDAGHALIAQSWLKTVVGD